MLACALNELSAEAEVKPGFSEGILTIELSELELEVRDLVRVLLKNWHKGLTSKNILLLGENLDNFLNYYRKQSIIYYAKRGKVRFH